MACPACQYRGLPETSRCHCVEMQALIAEQLIEVKKTAATHYGNIGFGCNGKGGRGNQRAAGNTRSVAPQLVTRLSQELDVTDEDVLYDIGCGCGSVAVHIALTTGANVYGLDNNQACIDISRLLLGEGGTLVERAVPGRKNRYMLVLHGGCEDVPGGPHAGPMGPKPAWGVVCPVPAADEGLDGGPCSSAICRSTWP